MHVFLLNLFLTFNQKLISHGEEARGGCIATRMYLYAFSKKSGGEGDIYSRCESRFKQKTTQIQV